MVSVTGLSPSQMLSQLNKEFGDFVMVEDDMRFDPEMKNAVEKTLLADKRLPEFADEIIKVSYNDGCKIYFEDGFAQYHTYKYNSSSYRYVLTDEDKWTLAKDENFSSLQGAHQDEDRPGAAQLPQIDADNLYLLQSLVHHRIQAFPKIFLGVVYGDQDRYLWIVQLAFHTFHMIGHILLDYSNT
jgi:hypothetical protein